MREKARGQASRQQACGELERQSLPVKAQKRRGNRVLLAHKTTALVKRGNNKTMSVDKTNVHALSFRVNTLPRVHQRNGDSSLSGRSAVPNDKSRFIRDRVQRHCVFTQRNNKVRGRVAPRSSWREINELTPLISARAVYHAGLFVMVSGFCRRGSFCDRPRYLGVSLLFYLIHGFRVAFEP